MATLIIKSKSNQSRDAADSPKTRTTSASKTPVRRADPAKRPRVSAPEKAASDAAAKASGKPRGDNAYGNKPRNENTRAGEQNSAPASNQRNHRHDGKPRDEGYAQHEPSAPRRDYAPAAPRTDTAQPQDRAQTRPPASPKAFNGKKPDSRAPADRSMARGEFKRDEYVRKPRDEVVNNPQHDAEAHGTQGNNVEGRNTSPRGDTRNTAGRYMAERDTPRRGGKERDGFEQGSFNSNRASNPMFADKPLASNPDQPRLSKRMTELGLCSRREADDWIINGWVKVDGKILDTLGVRVSLDAQIEVSEKAKQYQSESVTIILHKPVGYVSGQAEDGYQPAITLIHPDNQWLDDPELHQANPKEFQRGFLHGLAPAGRLDIDSTGILVFTQDGRVAKHLIGENSSVEKEYLVRVEGDLSDADFELLNYGLSLDGVQLKPAKVSWQNEDQLRFVLREGRKRQIRRMCELVGLHVVGLKRVRTGSVSLGKLPVGQWRYLRMDERF